MTETRTELFDLMLLWVKERRPSMDTEEQEQLALSMELSAREEYHLWLDNA